MLLYIPPTAEYPASTLVLQATPGQEQIEAGSETFQPLGGMGWNEEANSSMGGMSLGRIGCAWADKNIASTHKRSRCNFILCCLFAARMK